MSKNPNRITGTATYEWINIDTMRISPRAQREQKPGKIQNIARNFDPDKLGIPTVSRRDGHHWVTDGGHRVEAMRALGMGGHEVYCKVLHGLTEQQEAELFLGLNEINPVTALDRFQVAVVADREIEVDIDRIVRKQGMHVGGGTGGIKSVSALKTIYVNGGPESLAQTIRIISESYGDLGFKAPIIGGIGLVTQRYGDKLDEAQMIQKLHTARGGLAALINGAGMKREQTGEPTRECHAAAAVDLYNRGKGKKIAKWFAGEAAA